MGFNLASPLPPPYGGFLLVIMTGIAERQATALSSRQRTSLRNHLAKDMEQTRLLIERLTEEMSVFLSARRDSPTDDEHDPEGPTLAFERSQSSVMLHQARQHLAEIEAALLRLDDGSYGLCAQCDTAIALARLEARPQASLCITCAGKLR